MQYDPDQKTDFHNTFFILGNLVFTTLLEYDLKFPINLDKVILGVVFISAWI